MMMMDGRTDGQAGREADRMMRSSSNNIATTAVKTFHVI
jgi:hypothetical protein